MSIDPSISKTEPRPITEFYLVGLRLNGRREKPDFFTFLLEQNDEMRPLLHEQQWVLFTHLELAAETLRSSGIEVEFRSLGMENVYLIDVAQSLYLLSQESADPQRSIANMLDLFAKVLTGLGIGVPPVFADTLIDLGNYVDTHEYYGDFMEQETFRREKAVDAVRWCLGTALSVARIITIQGVGDWG